MTQHPSTERPDDALELSINGSTSVGQSQGLCSEKGSHVAMNSYYAQNLLSNPRRIAVEFTARWRLKTYGNAKARGPDDEEQRHYLELIVMLDTIFTRDSIELFALNPAVCELDFLASREPPAVVPPVPHEPWQKMRAAHLLRFNKLFQALIQRANRDENILVSIAKMSPEQKIAMQEVSARIKRFGCRDHLGTVKEEQSIYDTFISSLRAQYEEESVIKYVEDPFQNHVLVPTASATLKSLSPDSWLDGFESDFSQQAPWFQTYLNNKSFLLMHSEHIHRNSHRRSPSWEKLHPAQHTAFLDGEWRRQTYGSIWSTGTIEEEEDHFENMREDLDDALQALRSVQNLLGLAWQDAPARVTAGLTAVRAWNTTLADTLGALGRVNSTQEMT